MNDQPQQQQINIELGEKEAEGIYSNLAIITHSPAEFVIDFTRVLPGVPKAKVHARLVMTPQHTKMLLNALKDNIDTAGTRTTMASKWFAASTNGIAVSLEPSITIGKGKHGVTVGGRVARARAIDTRWRCPPLNWWGNLPRISSGRRSTAFNDSKIISLAASFPSAR